MRKKLAVLVLLVVGLTIGGPWAATAAPLTPQTFNVTLLPSGDSDGSGTAEVTLDLRTGTVCYDISVTGVDAPTEPAPGLGNAHIHDFASGGGIAVDLETSFTLMGGSYVADGCVTVRKRSELVEILLHPEDYYVNVHTATYPGGAVQGFLG